MINNNQKIIQERREERGLFQASSFLRKEVQSLIKNNEPLGIGLIIKAHKILFHAMGSADAEIGGVFRKGNDPELKRIDGTPLKMSDYKNIANDIAILDEELKTKTKNLKRPSKDSQLKNIFTLAAVLSHRLASIHPFQNGNGRASRLLLSSILKRAGLYWLESNVSVNFKKEEKGKYLRAMRQADEGDYPLLEKIIEQSQLQTALRLYKQRQNNLNNNQ